MLVATKTRLSTEHHHALPARLVVDEVGEVRQDGLDLGEVPGVDVEQVEVVLRVGSQEGPRLVPEIRVLEEERDRVHPEAVHALLYPELEDVQHLADHGRVPVVEVRLLPG